MTLTREIETKILALMKAAGEPMTTREICFGLGLELPFKGTEARAHVYADIIASLRSLRTYSFIEPCGCKPVDKRELRFVTMWRLIDDAEDPRKKARCPCQDRDRNNSERIE